MVHAKERGKSVGSPLEAVAGDAGPRATEAFAILGNETRLAILLALWEAYEPWATENAVSFTELRDRVGIPQGSQFTYHLDQLIGHFVRKTDAGYELRRTGHRIVRTVIAGTGFEDPALDLTEVDRGCPLCGAPTAVIYHDELLMHVCTECDGRFGTRNHFPAGGLAAADLDPAGVSGRSPEELLNAAFIRGAWNTQSAIEGVCEACSSPMGGWLHVCDDHPSEGVCPNCERRAIVVARFRCPVCKNHHSIVPWCSWLVMHHPAVVAFYYDRGIPLQYESGEDGSFQPRYGEIDPAEELDHELLSVEPPQVRVTFRHEDAELALTLDEELNVVEVDERP